MMRLLLSVGLLAVATASFDNALLSKAEGALVALRGTAHAQQAEAALADLRGNANLRRLKKGEYEMKGSPDASGQGPWRCAKSADIIKSQAACEAAAKQLVPSVTFKALNPSANAVGMSTALQGCYYRPGANIREGNQDSYVFFNPGKGRSTGRAGQPAICHVPAPEKCTAKFVQIGTAKPSKGPWRCPKGKTITTEAECAAAAKFLKVGAGKVWTLRGMEKKTNSVKYVPGCSFRPVGPQPGRNNKAGPFKVFFNGGVGTAPGTVGHPSLCYGDDNVGGNYCADGAKPKPKLGPDGTCSLYENGVTQAQADLDTCRAA